jgi:sulfonate transport system ATP-binding protein
MCAKYRPTVLFVTHDVEEALLLADRVLVLADGHFVHDEPVTFPSPRRRADVEFQAMRERVMDVLGVVDEMPHA